MRELNGIEVQEVNGGVVVIVPLVIVAGKAVLAGFAAGAAAYGLYFAARAA